MISERRLRLSSLALTLLIIYPASLLDAQLQSGNLHGLIIGENGEALPGVTVELSGLGATLLQTTDTQGQFRFLSLAPGGYRVAASLEGFSSVVHDNVTVAVGRNTAIEVTLPSAVEEVITVTAESPVLDERKISAGAIVTLTELEKVPSSRDPWVVLQTVPGVLTTAVNVGGNKSGFQQAFTGSGSFGWANAYAMDGVVLTDAAAGNSSGSYYDFEAFEEMEVSTGGSDVSVIGNGVTLNLVTKRGTNDWRVSTRYLVADQAWQADLAPDPGSLGEGQEEFNQGDRIVRIEEYGVEAGGPLLRNRLWGWGFYGRNNIDRLTIDDVRDLTELETFGFKLNAQVSSSNSAVAFFHESNKVVDGRGAGPTRPGPTTHYHDGESRIFKLEDAHVFSNNFFLSGLIAQTRGPFSMIPKGGLYGLNTVLDQDFIYQNNYFWLTTVRPQDQASLDSSYFLTTGELSHELRFGASFRTAETYSEFGWPGDVVRYDFYRDLGYPYNIAEVNRQEAYAYTTTYTSLFAQDTLIWSRLTANLGLRYDLQKGQLDSASVPGVPGFEMLPDGTPFMPAVTFDGRNQDFAWGDLAPRLGLTYALTSDRSTLLRGSFSRFSTPMDQWYQYLEWPIGPSWAGFFYEDANGDERVTVDEIICYECGPLYTNGYDPLAQEGLYDIDPGLKAPLSDEIILGVEHSFLPELIVGLSTTWRNQTRTEEYERLVVEDGVERTHRRDDYELQYVHTAPLPDGSSSEVEVWGLRDGIEDTGRQFVTNGARETDYLGFNLTLHKRLSQRWMLRGYLSWAEWTWSVPDSERQDPNVRTDGSGWDDNGGPVFQYPITPGWSYRLGGLVQIAPEKSWGVDVSGNLWGRQGYAIYYFTTQYGVFATEPELDLQAVRPLDDYRLPDLHLLDLRVEKPVTLGDFGLSFAVECFNVFNESTVLKRTNRLEASTTNWVQEVVNPRVFRLSIRLRYR